MKLIPVSQGQVAMVDDEDFSRMSGFQWSLSYGYAVRGWRNNGKHKTISMHREIMNASSDILIDHKDHDRLNNQKDNLRRCTRSQNAMNRLNNSRGSSKFKGVSAFTSKGYKYYASGLMINGRKITKLFPHTIEGEIEAAIFYNTVAKKIFGEFAHLNKIA